MIFKPGITLYFLTYLHQHWYTCPITYNSVETCNIEVLTVVSGTSAPLFQSHHHQWNVCHQGGFFSEPNRWKSLGALRWMIKKFPLQFMNSLMGCLGCMGSGIVMIMQYPSCQLGWMFSANCITELQYFTAQCRIHIFTTLLKMG
jgi:hypothetical protein